MLFQLLLSVATSLGLLALRETSARGVLLSAFIGVSLSLFVTVPCSKFIHGIRRSVALLRQAHDRIASPIAEGSNL
jgi:citrate/tricarballylate utilization protein